MVRFKAFQQLGDPGQRRYHLLNVGPKVELAAFDPLKNGRGLLYQRHPIGVMGKITMTMHSPSVQRAARFSRQGMRCSIFRAGG